MKYATDQSTKKEVFNHVLISANHDYFSYPFLLKKMIKLDDFIDERTFLSSIKIFELNLNLKRLFIGNVLNSSIYGTIIEKLNSFIKLEKLEFYSPIPFKMDFKLNELKILSIKMPFKMISKRFIKSNNELIGANSKIILDTPKLQAFRSNRPFDFHFLYPQMIKHLELDTYNAELLRFRNLEVLVCGCFSHERNFLPIYPNLKQLKIRYCFSMDDFDKIDYVLKQKVIENRSDFNVYLDGVKMTDTNKLMEWKSNKLNPLKFQIHNFDLLDDFNHVHSINYDQLIKIPVKVEDKFFEKYYNIQHVEASSKIEDKLMFCDFLKKANRLKSLKLKNTELDQEFYNQLPKITQLTRLTIIEEKNVSIRFDFIYKLKWLVALDTNQKSDLTPDVFSLTKLQKVKDQELEMIFNEDQNNYNLTIKCPYVHRKELTFQELMHFHNHRNENQTKKIKNHHSNI